MTEALVARHMLHLSSVLKSTYAHIDTVLADTNTARTHLYRTHLGVL